MGLHRGGKSTCSRMLSSLLLILFPAGLLAEPGDKCDAWQVGNLWQVGYDANLVFIVDHTVSSWTVHLEFDSPLESLDCYIAQASSSDNIHWSVTNLDWDGE